MANYDKTDIIFYGLMRSGNHAIIHWLAKAISAPLKENFGSRIYINQDKKKKLVFFNDCTRTVMQIINIFKRYSDYENIWASVEDCYKRGLIVEPILKNPIQIFIFRNITDCYKSRKKLLNSSLESTIEKYLNLYKESQNNSNNIIILYDSWLNSEEYRKDILMKIGIPVNKEALELIPNITRGPGFSSFIDKNYIELTKKEIQLLEETEKFCK